MLKKSRVFVDRVKYIVITFLVSPDLLWQKNPNKNKNLNLVIVQLFVVHF